MTIEIVEAHFARFNEAWASGDAQTVADLFAPGAVLLATVSNKPRTTRAEIVDYFDHFLANKPVSRIDTSVIRLGCNMAARFGTWTIELTDPKTGAKSTVPARFTFIYRFEDGEWAIDHLHSSKMPETSPTH
ncbi:MAG: SgcJ/EcaC family oxidoreductase [Alphaproteobacteria bacterium]